jgi:hypothetical protein
MTRRPVRILPGAVPRIRGIASAVFYFPYYGPSSYRRFESAFG